MKQRRLNCVLLDVKNGCFGTMNIVDSLDCFYKYIDCETITITERRIGRKYFDIIADDEGLLIDNPIPSAFDSRLEPALVGNLIIAGRADRNGNLTNLSPDDATEILKHIQMVGGIQKELYPALVGCDY